MSNRALLFAHCDSHSGVTTAARLATAGEGPLPPRAALGLLLSGPAVRFSSIASDPLWKTTTSAPAADSVSSAPSRCANRFAFFLRATASNAASASASTGTPPTHISASLSGE